jgi:hypothetical protein
MAVDLDTPATRTGCALGRVEAAAGELGAALAGGGARDLSHEQLTRLVAAARRAQARLEAAVLAAVGEVDARGSFVHDGALTAGAWLRAHTRATPGEATTTVRTARVLRTGVLPATADALGAGLVSGRHAQVIAAAVADAPAGAAALIEPEALAVAVEADVRAVAAVMRQFQHALDPEDADRAAVARYGRRGLTLAPTLDGTVALSGLADEESASVIATALDTAAPLITGDTRTPAQRRLDAITDICRRFLAAPDTPRDRGGRPHVIVTTDDSTLRGEAPSPGATLSWVGHITASTAHRVACDAQLTTVTLGPDGEVTQTRTDRRYFTPAQRRAMIARDGDRCIWPWCDRPAAWSDGHHLQHWARGGPTTVTNGALPCTAHHTALHEGGWTATREPDGRYTMRHRDGRTIGPDPHPPGHNRPPPHGRE